MDYVTYFSESFGSPFLNELVTRNVSSCIDRHGRNCLPKIELGMESCDKELICTGYKDCNNCQYETQEKLQVVEIYFDTPTFDKITKDARTNNIAKFSMIGGTLGLLTGG